ncbi:MAG: pyruvate dehydrogenase (acetyl-transferring), homodimeric type, partial [Lentisphaeria bacterium]|nr:pyruvate dehydrogenase (acetyl-transferring), homodimeric type [Lentisphaeria bacterium]
LMNDNYPQRAMPEGVREGILRGLYQIQEVEDAQVRLFGSGAILPETLKAAKRLEEFGVRAAVWSATSYKELYRDAASVARWNRNHPLETPRRPYLLDCLAGSAAPVVAACDYVRALPESIARWMPARYAVLGTDGFGRSDGRPALRDFFEVDAAHIAYAALVALAEEGTIAPEIADQAAATLGIRRDSADPETR